MRFLLGFVSGLIAIAALGRATQGARASRPVGRPRRIAVAPAARPRLRLSQYYYVSRN
ncbi:MAG: hypothetical protein K1X71_07750 [Pirellulales bacterium]|nr:hypothetical protein [Pirellulales bacterium]